MHCSHSARISLKTKALASVAAIAGGPLLIGFCSAQLAIHAALCWQCVAQCRNGTKLVLIERDCVPAPEGLSMKGSGFLHEFGL